MKKITWLTLAALTALAFFTACRHDPDIPTAPSMQASFQTDVQPVISGNCSMAGCHAAASSGSEERARPLVTYNDVMQYVTAGDARNSRLYDVIHNPTSHQMPPNSHLATDQIKFIYLWIEQGAKNN